MARSARAETSEKPAPVATPHGKKGARTRRRIMEATAALLAHRPLGDVRITEVARAAEIAQPNFYTYFASIEDVVLALGEDFSVGSLAELLDPDWDGEQGFDLARRFVEAAIALLREHGPVLSIVNMLADQQHGEFPSLRVRQMRSLYKGFEAKIRQAQAAGRLSPAINPRLAGYECVGLLSSTAQRYDLFRNSGFSHPQLVETTARLLHRLVGAS